jgi:hypothetical protein
MCIKVGCGARAGWTPSAACPGCPLVKAIRARQAVPKAADDGPEQVTVPAAALARVRGFLKAAGIGRPH